MPTIQSAFLELLRRVELNPSRVALASQRYNAIKSVIASDIGGATVQQVGSFHRQTKIRPRDLSDSLDVDALVVLNEVRAYPSSGGLSPAGAVQRIITALRRNQTYEIMEPSLDAPAVILEYADGFSMEIVPGFSELTGKYPRAGGPPCYIVPGSGAREWVPADYDFDASRLTIRNQSQESSGLLVPSIKLLKDLLRNWKLGLNSFHIEILAAEIIPPVLMGWRNNNKSFGYQHIVADFLSQAHALLHGPVMFEGSYSTPVDSGLSLSELRSIGGFLSSHGSEAWELCRIENLDQACTQWKNFWGEPFPTSSAL